MTERWEKFYSQSLDREMEYAVFGEDDAEKLCLAFPPQNGRYYDFHNFGMVETARPWIDEGRLQIVCPDGIDGETWSNEQGDPRARLELQERWFRSVVDSCFRALPAPQKNPWSADAAWAGSMRGSSFSAAPTCSTCF